MLVRARKYEHNENMYRFNLKWSQKLKTWVVEVLSLLKKTKIRILKDFKWMHNFLKSMYLQNGSSKSREIWQSHLYQ